MMKLDARNNSPLWCSTFATTGATGSGFRLILKTLHHALSLSLQETRAFQPDITREIAGSRSGIKPDAEQPSRSPYVDGFRKRLLR